MAEKAGAAMRHASTTGLTHSRVFEAQLAIVTGEIRRKAIWVVWGKLNRDKVLAGMRKRLGLADDEPIPLKNGRWDTVLENSVKKESYEEQLAVERAAFEAKHRHTVRSVNPDL